MRTLLAVALRRAGHAALAAADGAAALDLLRGRPDPRLRAVLLDLDMPVIDGTAFAAANRQLPPPHAPLVVISGAADAAPRARAIGAAAVLPTPFGIRDLRAVLENRATTWSGVCGNGRSARPLPHGHTGRRRCALAQLHTDGRYAMARLQAVAQGYCVPAKKAARYG